MADGKGCRGTSCYVFTSFRLLMLFSFNVCKSSKVGNNGGTEFELITKDRIEAGQSKLKEFSFKAQSSDCWKRAIEGIEQSCKNLGDIQQSYLAIDFTNCHLSKSGRKSYSCSRETQTVEQCTKEMDDTTFLTYSTFFAHTANICFYLKSEVWQQRTEDTISKLSRTSRDVAVQLEDSARKQLLVLAKQNVSLENQRKIIHNEVLLSETLKNSTTNAKIAFEDMRQSAVEQKALFTETFDGVFKRVESIRKLQSLILGEFISLQSVAFYLTAACTCYFFTSAPRTAGGRLPLLIGLAVLICIERVLTSWGVTNGQSTDTEVIHARLWFCRKLFTILAAIVLMVVGYRYQDYTKINFDMLREIQLQIRDMKVGQENTHALKAITYGDSQIVPSSHSLLLQESSTRGSVGHPSFPDGDLPCDMRDAAIRGSSHYEDDDESDDSYVPSDSDLESITEESSDEEEHYEQISSSHGMNADCETPVTRRRSKGIPTERNSTSVRSQQSRKRFPLEASPSYHYNLRSRINTTSSLHGMSFFSNMPSPSTFHEMLVNLKRCTSRHYTAVTTKPASSDTSNTKSMFSSDEEG